VSPAAPFAGRTVLLLGHFDDSYSGHATLKRRALERLGCKVVVVEPRPSGFFARFKRSDVVERLGAALREHLPDLVLTLGAELPPPAAVGDLRMIHPAPWTLWWHSDSGQLPTSDAVQSVDRTWVTSADLVARIPGVRYLPHGCDPSVHRPLRSRDEYRANVVFVGDATPRREALVTEVLECGVAVWGAGWRKTRLKDYCRGEMVEVEEYVRAYAGATVALNFHREGPEGEVPSSSGCNARTFELAAMGVAQVVDAREDLPHLFEDGSEVVTFADPSALKGIVRELVSDHARAEELGHAARRRALGEHTYMHRLSLLLEDQLGA
jgi:glycosyltransferase involved in cell wall biosynthesis